MKNLLLGSNNHKPKHGSHQQSITKALDSVRVDMETVDFLKEEIRKEKANQNSIKKVRKNLLSLEKQLHKATNQLVN